MQVCRACRLEQPQSAFHRNKTKRSGYQSQCKTCVNSRVKAWYRSSGGAITRNTALGRKFGITSEEYEQLKVQQGGCCAICGREGRGRHKALAVDHNHITGRVRGLLCHPCNMALGQFQDDASRLLRAVEYLRAAR